MPFFSAIGFLSPFLAHLVPRRGGGGVRGTPLYTLPRQQRRGEVPPHPCAYVLAGENLPPVPPACKLPPITLGPAREVPKFIDGGARQKGGKEEQPQRHKAKARRRGRGGGSSSCLPTVPRHHVGPTRCTTPLVDPQALQLAGVLERVSRCPSSPRAPQRYPESAAPVSEGEHAGNGAGRAVLACTRCGTAGEGAGREHAQRWIGTQAAHHGLAASAEGAGLECTRRS